MDGIIKEINLSNFITYDKIKINPGPKLNIIIGPNGSGKSSILSAILLAMGGKPKLLGRMLDISSFIKYGQDVATIEIILNNNSGRDYVIKRTINRRNESVWELNGSYARLAEVEALTMKLCIQVDNLCQFLPQDRIHEFSGLNPQDLLLSTEKSAGPPEMFAYHKVLGECTSRLKELYKKEEECLKQLQGEKAVLSKAQEDIEYMEEKKRIIDMSKTLMVNRIYAKYKKIVPLKEQMEGELRNYQSIYEENKSIYDSYVTKNKYLEEIIRVLRGKSVGVYESTYGKLSHIQNLRQDLLKATSSFKNREEELRMNEEQKEKTKHEIESLISIIQSFECDLLTFNRDEAESIKARMQELDEEIEPLRVDICHIQEKSECCSKHLKFAYNEIKKQEQLIENATNIRHKHEELLQKRFPQEYKGVKWLNDNRHLFSKNVYGPMFMEVHVKRPEYGKYLEHIIPFRDLQAFTCETKPDMNKLIQGLRDELGLVINVLHSGGPSSGSYFPNIAIDNLRPLGFFSYLRELMQAPEPILRYLCKRFGIHRVPVGTSIINRTFSMVPPCIRTFFSDCRRYDSGMSRYSRESTYLSYEISGPGFLNIPINKEAVDEAENKLAKLRMSSKQAKISLDALEKDAQLERSKLDEVRANKAKLNEKFVSHLMLEARLKVKKNHLQHLQTDVITNKEMKTSIQKYIQDALLKVLNTTKQLQTAIEQYLSFIQERVPMEDKLDTAMEESLLLKREMFKLKSKCDLSQENITRFQTQFNDVLISYTRAREAVLTLSKGVWPDEEFLSSIPSVENIDREISANTSKITFMTDTMTMSFSELTSKLERVEELQKKCYDINSKIKEEIDKAEPIKEKWLPMVESMVQRIDKKFGEYFAEMGCVGEVSLRKAPKDNYKNYGLRIMVKFHAEDDLCELDSRRQSGGERSVTIALFLMSMQGIAHVPFRCVDEINQGMDPFNERRILKLLFDSTSSKRSSQYFLLSPKLLPSLQYSTNTNIIVVYSMTTVHDDGCFITWLKKKKPRPYLEEMM